MPFGIHRTWAVIPRKWTNLLNLEHHSRLLLGHVGSACSRYLFFEESHDGQYLQIKQFFKELQTATLDNIGRQIPLEPRDWQNQYLTSYVGKTVEVQAKEKTCGVLYAFGERKDSLWIWLATSGSGSRPVIEISFLWSEILGSPKLYIKVVHNQLGTGYTPVNDEQPPSLSLSGSTSLQDMVS